VRAGAGRQLLQRWGEDPRCLLAFCEPGGLGHAVLLAGLEPRLRVLQLPLPQAGGGLSAAAVARAASACEAQHIVLWAGAAAAVQAAVAAQGGEGGADEGELPAQLLGYGAGQQLALPLRGGGGGGREVALGAPLLAQLQLQQGVAVRARVLPRAAQGGWELR
jgi:hypothetical protein